MILLYILDIIIAVLFLLHLINAKGIWSELSPLERAKVTYGTIIYSVTLIVIGICTAILTVY